MLSLGRSAQLCPNICSPWANLLSSASRAASRSLRLFFSASSALLLAACLALGGLAHRARSESRHGLCWWEPQREATVVVGLAEGWFETTGAGGRWVGSLLASTQEGVGAGCCFSLRSPRAPSRESVSRQAARHAVCTAPSLAQHECLEGRAGRAGKVEGSGARRLRGPKPASCAVRQASAETGRRETL